MPNLEPYLIPLASGFVGAAITSIFAHGRFKREWWWQQKANAYSKLIFALHESLQFSEAHLDALMRSSEVIAETDGELRAKSKQAMQLINQARDTGMFFLSKKAVDRLDLYFSEQSKTTSAESWYDHLDADFASTKSCLNDIIALAKVELSSTWLSRWRSFRSGT